MGVDLRQVVAGILTLTMFVMLGNMIKREHFDYVEVRFYFFFPMAIASFFIYVSKWVFIIYGLDL